MIDREKGRLLGWESLDECFVSTGDNENLTRSRPRAFGQVINQEEEEAQVVGWPVDDPWRMNKEKLRRKDKVARLLFRNFESYALRANGKRERYEAKQYFHLCCATCRAGFLNIWAGFREIFQILLLLQAEDAKKPHMSPRTPRTQARNSNK